MNLESRIAEPLINDPAADEQLRQRVCLSLRRCGFPSICRLDVIAESGVVTLRGIVPTYYTRQLAVCGAIHVAGVRQVVDEICVRSADVEAKTPRPK
jgi:osmotically-inducible protein OsmY